MTLWLYPSQWRLDLIQLLQVGLPSSHLIRRFRQAKIDICQLLYAPKKRLIEFTSKRQDSCELTKTSGFSPLSDIGLLGILVLLWTVPMARGAWQSLRLVGFRWRHWILHFVFLTAWSGLWWEFDDKSVDKDALKEAYAS